MQQITEIAKTYNKSSSSYSEDDEEERDPESIIDEDAYVTDVTGDAPGEIQRDNTDDLNLMFRIFMDELTSDTIPPGGERVCPLCEEDETIIESFLASGAFKLQRHINTGVHTQWNYL